MRRGFNLIELIFTIVIMAGIFSVIPKIMFAASKSDSFATKQEAFFNAISLTSIASFLAWDENNTQSMSILSTTPDSIPCHSATHLRVGGFLGSFTRNCEESFSASSIGSDGGEVDYLSYDDIDDFNSTPAIDVNIGSKTKYKIHTSVTYLSDAIFSQNSNKLTIDLNATAVNTTTNIKKFKAVIEYVGGRGVDKNISSFYYYSTNIGQMALNSRSW